MIFGYDSMPIRIAINVMEGAYQRRLPNGCSFQIGAA